MDALRFYDVETATVAVSLSLGTVAPASSDDTLLRVQNISDLYQAEDVTVQVSTGPDAVQLWLSADGDRFSSSIDVGAVPPGGYSPPFWLRRVTPSTNVGGACNAALQASCASWSNPVDTSLSTNVPISTEDDD